MAHTILIIDDNPDDIEITRIVLSKMGHEVKIEAALCGEAALERLRSGEELPSIILLDLKMSGMGGFDVLRQIRGDERLQHIPVIVVTSSSLESDEKKSYEAGANTFLHKAFDMDRFSRDIKHVLARWIGE